ncbi:MAG: DUF3316 domain-containing protein [Bacteroides sp.]|nr:DUF3316 domain-containing protein [Bacteroides sp.]
MYKGIGKLISAAVLTICLPVAAGASEAEEVNNSCSRPVTGVYSIEIGGKNVLATYLSPLHYKGTSVGLSGAWSKAMPFNPESVIMHFNAYTAFDDMLNPAQTARMIALSGSFNWGMSWRKMIPWQLQLTAGGSVGIDGGAYWLTRNGNNPVQAMASVNIAARASLARPFKIGKLDLLVRDEVSLPSLSVFFSPEYGESYYEIYLGNHKGLVHPGWWGNNFRIDNLFSVTFDFGRTAAMVGYRFKADTQWANNLNTQIMTHSFVIGVIPGGIGLKPKPKRIPSETIYSLY